MNSSSPTHVIFFACLKCVIPRFSSFSHQLKQLFANAFISPEK